MIPGRSARDSRLARGSAPPLPVGCLSDRRTPRLPGGFVFQGVCFADPKGVVSQKGFEGHHQSPANQIPLRKRASVYRGKFVVEQSNPVESERALVAAIVALFCGPQLHPSPRETAEDLNREFGHADLRVDGPRDVLAGKADLRVDTVAGLRSCTS